MHTSRHRTTFQRCSRPARMHPSSIPRLCTQVSWPSWTVMRRDGRFVLRTWLPDESYVRSATLLHDEEVHKVRQHVYYILEVLAGRQQHMRHSPTVTMWRGAELSLVAYGVTMCREWKTRGQKDSLEEK